MTVIPSALSSWSSKKSPGFFGRNASRESLDPRTVRIVERKLAEMGSKVRDERSGGLTEEFLAGRLSRFPATVNDMQPLLSLHPSIPSRRLEPPSLPRYTYFMSTQRTAQQSIAGPHAEVSKTTKDG